MTAQASNFRFQTGPSRISPDAGEGLFLHADSQTIPRGEPFVWYGGDSPQIHKAQECTDSTYCACRGGYFHVDARHHLSGKANDNFALSNSRMEWVTRRSANGARPFLMARRDIIPGEEITYQYGSRFWCNRKSLISGARKQSAAEPGSAGSRVPCVASSSSSQPLKDDTEETGTSVATPPAAAARHTKLLRGSASPKAEPHTKRSRSNPRATAEPISARANSPRRSARIAARRCAP